MRSVATTLLILGAQGDLTKRLLLPGLGSLIAGGEKSDLDLLDGLAVLGAGRTDMARSDFQKLVRDGLTAGGANGDLVEGIAGRSDFIAGDVTSADDWKNLLAHVQDDLVIYFALPPAVAGKAAPLLASLDLPERTVLALEKPFGNDQQSAHELNEQLAKIVPEGRIHRVDHFLGQRALLALIALRSNNRLFEPIWNADDIERVEIVYDEQLGLEGRAGYYDHAGALRDMLQSHLLEAMAVVAMEPIASTSEHDLRAATAAVLRATSVWSGAPVFPNTDGPSRRARYTAGTVDGKHYPDYAKEDGVDPANHTETLAEIALHIDTARWAGIPFVLRSGKAIGEPADRIRVHLRPVRHRPDGQTGSGTRERIDVGFKPPRVSFRFTASGGEEPFALEPGKASGSLKHGPVTEYGEVLRGVLGDDPTLAVRGDTAEECWRIVQPVLDAWANDDVPLDEYPAGSDGPAEWKAD